MRILKYILLLLLLFSVAFMVFVATQKGDYKITRSKEIKVSKDIVFSFVSDSTSFQDWSPWKSNATLKNLTLTSNDSLSQLINISGIANKSSMRFQKTKDGVLVTWEIKGSLNFKLKFLSVVQGGVESVLGKELNNGLQNIDNYLIKELTSYEIKVNGAVTKHMTNYIQQIDTFNTEDFHKVSKKMLQNMMQFVKKNEIVILGLPFITYENINLNKKEIVFAMCVPVEEEILTTPGSEISGGHFDEFLAVKTTLVGDYSHRKEAWSKARAFAKKNKLKEEPSLGKFIEIYKVSLPNERKPSMWVTELYLPVRRIEYAPKPETDTSNEVTSTSTEVTSKQ